MADTPLYLYEFLWRGRPSGDGGAYHVILAQDTKDAFGAASTATSGALTPEQAKAQGFDLKTVFADINADALAEAGRLKTQIGELEGKFATLQAKLVATSPPAGDATGQGSHT